MLFHTSNETAVRDTADGASIEYAAPVLDELRRLAVEGFLAFGHGGLEVGGVLYGTRDAERISVLASAGFTCEYALGPGFVLSKNDRNAFLPLLDPPAGLETLGWYRSHTRSGLSLDTTDRDLFEPFLAGEKTLGLVLKPTQWGQAGAAFYVREMSGEILPPTPREFTLEAPRRRFQVCEPAQCATADEDSAAAATVAQSETEAEPVEVAGPAMLQRAPATTASTDGNGTPEVSFAQFTRRWRLAVAAAALGIAVLGFYLWSRPSRELALRAYPITTGQVRIDWNHRSLPVINGASGVLRILDGDEESVISLDANQLRLSSITYIQRNGHIRLWLRVLSRQAHAAPAEESLEFVVPPGPPSPRAVAQVSLENAAPPPSSPVPAMTAVAPSRPAPSAVVETALRERREAAKPPEPETAVAPTRRFQPPVLSQGHAAPAVAVLPLDIPDTAPAAPPQLLPDFFPNLSPRPWLRSRPLQNTPDRDRAV